jgi:hypothetical protein
MAAFIIEEDYLSFFDGLQKGDNVSKGEKGRTEGRMFHTFPQELHGPGSSLPSKFGASFPVS